MSSITEIEKLKLENLLSLGGGYVLNFSNQSFQTFIYKVVNVDVYNPKYELFGTSKAKRLKAIWEIEDDKKVGNLIENLLLYFESEAAIKGDIIYDKSLFAQCINISYRLQEKKITYSPPVVNTVEDFLQTEVDEVPVTLLKIDSNVTNILEQRIIEIKKCLSNDAALSVIFLCGSVLEGLLLGLALKRNIEFNKSTVSPKDKVSGKVKAFHEWSLSNFIDVAYDLQILGLDVKKFSHSLRDFRNYIHPFQQMSSGFTPDKHTAKISWQVLKAAIHDMYQSLNG